MFKKFKNDFYRNVWYSIIANVVGIPCDTMKLYKRRKHKKAGLYPCDNLAYRIDAIESFCDLIKYCDKYDNSLISQRMKFLEQQIIKSKEPELCSSVDKFLDSTNHELKK